MESINIKMAAFWGSLLLSLGTNSFAKGGVNTQNITPEDYSEIVNNTREFYKEINSNPEIRKQILKRVSPSRNKEKLDKYNQDVSEIVNNSQKYALDSLSLHSSDPNYLAKISKKVSGKNGLLPSDEGKLLILVSMGIPKSELKSIMEAANNLSVPVNMAFRGLLPGTKNLNQTFRKAYSLKKGFKNISLTLDPRPFKDFNPSAVPLYIWQNSEDSVPHTSYGIVSPKWFINEAQKKDKKFNLGVNGETYPIVEKDWLTEIKERMDKIDWNQKREQAFNRFWDRYNFTTLEKASKDNSKLVDLSFKATKDFSVGGKIALPSGTVINPLKMVPYTATMIVFDGTDPYEIAFAKNYAKKNIKTPRVQFVSTKFNKGIDGWKNYDFLNGYFKSNVPLLQKRIKNRFKITKTPSIVYQEGDKIRVDEYLVKPENFSIEEIDSIRKGLKKDKLLPPKY